MVCINCRNGQHVNCPAAEPVSAATANAYTIMVQNRKTLCDCQHRVTDQINLVSDQPTSSPQTCQGGPDCGECGGGGTYWIDWEQAAELEIKGEDVFFLERPEPPDGTLRIRCTKNFVDI